MTYNIKGFSKYTIDDNLTITSYKRKTPKVLSSAENARSYVLIGDDRSTCQICAPKLLWCAQNGINPTSVPATSIMITKHYGVIDRSEFFRSIGHSSAKTFTVDEQLQYLTKNIEQQQRMLSSVSSGDYSWISSYLSAKQGPISHLLLKLGRCSISVADEIAHHAIFRVIEAISVRRQPVTDLDAYYLQTAKSLAKQYRSEHRHYKSFETNRYGRIFSKDKEHVLDLRR